MSDDELPPDNVRPIRPLTGRVGELVLPEKLRQGTIVRRTFGLREWCQHKETVVDSQARVVVCRRCEAELDPFDVLATVAFEWEFLASAIHERKDLEARIGELRDEEKRIKSRLRGAKRRAPAEAGELELLRRLETATRSGCCRLSQPMVAALTALDELRSKA